MVRRQSILSGVRTLLITGCIGCIRFVREQGIAKRVAERPTKCMPGQARKTEHNNVRSPCREITPEKHPHKMQPPFCEAGHYWCKASSGGKPKEKRVVFCTPRAAGACEISVSGFCRSGRIFAALVCLGECEVFASELVLAEACADPKSGPRGGPKFRAVLPFRN